MHEMFEYQAFTEPSQPPRSPLETDAVWLAVFLGAVIVAVASWWAWDSWRKAEE